MKPVNIALGLVLALATTRVEAKIPSGKSILLSSVKTLTLYDGRKTSHRRVSAIPQLTCIGGNAKGLYTVDVMRCQNSGSDYDKEDIQWTCQASLPPEFKLGSTEVICEGYDSPDDPRVLKGSCGVEYRLVLTDVGEEKYGRRQSTFYGDGYRSGGILGTIYNFLFWVAFMTVLIWIVYRIFVPGQGQNPRRPPNNGWFGWGGGGGGDGHDNDPPPPYTPRAPKPSSWSRTTRPSAYGPSAYGPSAYGPSHRDDQSWRPGFWSGAATGAAAGYFAGNRQSNSSRAREEEERRRSSSWYGSGAGGSSQSTRGNSLFGSGPSSTSTHESSGFGGTRRR